MARSITLIAKVSIICLTLVVPPSFAAGVTLKPRINLKSLESFYYDGFHYKYDHKGGSKVVFLQANQSADNRVLVGFTGRTADDIAVPSAFLTFGIQKGKKFKAKSLVQSADHFVGLTVFTANDGKNLVILRSNGGMHNDNIAIYEIVNDRLIPVFDAGSGCGIDVLRSRTDNKLLVKVFRDKFDVPGWSYAEGTDRWQMWGWNGSNFMYLNELSTDLDTEHSTGIIRIPGEGLEGAR